MKKEDRMHPSLVKSQLMVMGHEYIACMKHQHSNNNERLVLFWWYVAVARSDAFMLIIAVSNLNRVLCIHTYIADMHTKTRFACRFEFRRAEN